MINTKPRIAIYGMGRYGQHVVRFASSKGWKIVAAYNRAGSKVGQDVGRLAELGKDLGVIVQDCDTANYKALEADVAIVAITDRVSQNLPAYKRLMGAGVNVICHGGEAIYPQANEPQIAQEIDRIARQNNVTFTGTGVWDMTRVWAAKLITGACADIKSLFHRSVSDTENFGEYLLLGTGTGMTVEEFMSKVAPPGEFNRMYVVFAQLVMTSLGYTVTGCTEHIEPVVLDTPFFCKTLKREIAAGLCAGMRSVVEVTTQESVTCLAHIEARVLFRAGETEHTMWSVEGTPSPKIIIERDNGSFLSAISLLNRIADVIAAPPGIQLVTTLGPMKHSALG